MRPRPLRPLLTLVLLALTCCSGVLPPYETIPAPLSKVQLDSVSKAGAPPALIGVCYDSLTTTAEQVRTIAAQSCDPATMPLPVERDFSLMNCPLFQPARATFACVAKKP